MFCFGTYYKLVSKYPSFYILIENFVFRSGSRLGGVLYEDDVQKERELMHLDKGNVVSCFLKF